MHTVDEPAIGADQLAHVTTNQVHGVRRMGRWATAHQANRQSTTVWYASTFPSSPTLNRQQSQTLVQMLLEPPEPNAALQEAGEEYHRRVRHA
jgi:hypothetical protein